MSEKKKSSVFDDIKELTGFGFDQAQQEKARAEPKPRDPPKVREAPDPIGRDDLRDDELVPGRLGMMPADKMVAINVRLSAGLRYQFNLLVYTAGTDAQSVLHEFIERCVEDGRLPGRGDED